MFFEAFGHGLGSRGDLPIPLWQFSWAAIAALVISFLALGASWRQPKLSYLEKGKESPTLNKLLRAVEPFFRTISMGLFLLVLVTGFFGANDSGQNLNPVTISSKMKSETICSNCVLFISHQ